MKTVFLSLLLLCGATAAAEKPARGPETVDNVIVLIPDGCSQSLLTLARWYKGGPLTLDALHVGMVKHDMANSVITDSAAAATALATGYKTTGGFLGVAPRTGDVLTSYQWPHPPDTFALRPLATVLEGAQLKGKAAGLVATSRFTHATPAAWAAHWPNRRHEHRDIAEQMVHNDIDLVFGGGEATLIPRSAGGWRTDGEDQRPVLQERGYAYVRNREDMQALKKLPVWGVFAMSHMDAEMDRLRYNPDEPSLAEMTAKAIDLLASDPEGFFLMVEASQIDWAGHRNDPAYMVNDFLEFDEAVAVAVDFARRDGRTLVLAFPDHNTGGMAVGNRDYNKAYKHVTVEELVEPLRGMTVTAEALAEEIESMPEGVTADNIKAKIRELWNLDISDGAAREILLHKDLREGQDDYVIEFPYALSRIISKRYTAVGWTSHGHTAEDVPLWACGPGAPAGLVDNTDLADIVAEAFGLDMAGLNARLFVNLEEIAPGWRLDRSDPANPVARLAGGGWRAACPCNKDWLILENDSRTLRFNLEGVVVQTPDTERVYVPRHAVTLLREHGVLPAADTPHGR